MKKVILFLHINILYPMIYESIMNKDLNNNEFKECVDNENRKKNKLSLSGYFYNHQEKRNEIFDSNKLNIINDNKNKAESAHEYNQNNRDQDDTRQKTIFDFDSLRPILGTEDNNEFKTCTLGNKYKCKNFL